METSASEFVLKHSRDYILETALERAIPRVTDGLKDSQRIAAWIMHKRPEGAVKVAALSGEMIASNMYLHGDAGPTISKMAGPFINNNPIFEGIGNFGTLTYPGAFGAARYVYVKKSDFMRKVLLADSNLYTMVPSVDGDNEMCDTFLPLIPLVLLNGQNGMATGWSTNILPHKYEDLRDAVIRVLEGKPVGKINPYFAPYPDVKVVEVDNGRDNASAYNFYGKVEKINTNYVRIKTLPPGMSIDDIQEHLDDLIENKKIYEYTNNTSDTIDIVVKFNRQTLAELTEDNLVELFKLRTRDTERLVCSDFDGLKIRVFNNVEELITEWVKWRFPYIVQRFQVMIDETSEDLQYCYALRHLHQSQFVKLIPGFKSKDEMRKQIQKEVQEKYDLRPSRIERILDLAAYRWTVEYRDSNELEIDKLEKELFRLKVIREKDENMRKEWISDLKKIKV
ncbi:DNA gyrase subunit A protein [Rhizobium phage RHph_N34]|uniref:DNA topoisomerase (ATP-hydrolyzing) n=1 Tax=Rhizobium phage RHph_N34 TaxID=2509586 RepID=A0A7S5RA46_9CAUD|nr:DNA gyrase subunit A protein [Rhizobium phage RHph_N34]QIG73917.1 DNA gyrase subunit A protein [Rhizobium phage RHph_N34]